MFVILVASELYGHKHNIEVAFPASPAMSELIGHVESTLQIENRLMRPVGAKKQLLRIEYIQIFDEVLQRWVDLLSGTQLHEWAQLYVFQPDTSGSGNSRDVQAQIPSTRPIRCTPSGNTNEHLWKLFQDIDVNGNGYIERDELQRFFSVLGLFSFTEVQVDDFFISADTNRDGVLSYAEFSKFSSSHPQIISVLNKSADDYFSAVKVKDTEKAYLKLRYEEVEARYVFLQSRKDILLLEQKLSSERDAVSRTEAEQVLTEKTASLAAMKNAFIDQFGTDPASPQTTRPSYSVNPSEVGYGVSRKYPRTVSSPRFSNTVASPNWP
eukprot:TRINITY_DN6397_c0_g1_i1.p1 TRINITY_DN6397_c0_g1~~TRINITY_DN6397_c0_g1_i1.p1  ORF type:complete len:325 (+),score=50.13 TRINITY_DN6397_c0_g1_i1:157-1131(+)